MARQRKKATPSRERLLAPTHSLDPVDWREYCDLLRDAGAAEEKWARAGRIATSLAIDPKLVLINYCLARPLGGTGTNHWLRVGKTWFIGADGTYIEGNRLVWWRKTWVEEGFIRYPSDNPDRDVPTLIAMNYGVPWELPHNRYEILKKAARFKRLRPSFWDAHALAAIPVRYL